MKLQYIVRRYTSEVELLKDARCPLGISITSSQNVEGRPTITNIKGGSVAQKSHCLSEGDVILSVRGNDTRGMSKKSVKRFFKDDNPQFNMKVEYISREACFGFCRIYRSQRMFLTLRKVNGTFGFVLRKNSGFMEYPVISNIKHKTDSKEAGMMMDGDRLLEVDNHSLSWMPLADITNLLQNKEDAVFLVEYNVGVIDLSPEKETDLEITCPDTDLGMTVDSDDNLSLFISFIQQGSLAQRSGVFHVGDEILSINGIDVKTVSSAKANDLLRGFRKDSGKLTFIHKGENLKLETSLSLSTPMITPSSPTFSATMKVPLNSFTSLYYDPMPEDAFFKRIENFAIHNDYQLDIMSIVNDIQLKVDSLQLNLSNETSDKINDTSTSKNDILNNNEVRQSDWEWGTFKEQVHKLVKLTRTLVIRVINNAVLLNHDVGHGTRQKDNELPAVIGQFRIEFIDSLKDLSDRKLVSKGCANKLIVGAEEINTDCRRCVNEFYTASFAVRKVNLLLSLNNTTQDEFSTIQNVLRRVCRLPFPCYDCMVQVSTGSTSEASRTAENNLSIPRTLGASSSAANSAKVTQDENNSFRGSPIQTEPQVGLNLMQQTVSYSRLKCSRNTNVANSDSFCSSEERHTPLSSSRMSDLSSSTRYHEDAINYSQVSNHVELQQSADVAQFYENDNLKSDSAFKTGSNDSPTLTSITEADRHRAMSNTGNPNPPPATPKYTFARHSTPLPQSPLHKPIFQCKNSTGFDVRSEEPIPVAGPSHVVDNFTGADKTHFKTHHPDTLEVLLKAEDRNFGFILGYSSLQVHDERRVPFISAIKPKSAAHKCGLLKKGDRILALNGFGTVGVSIEQLESLQRGVFTYDEVVLTVEFDVMDATNTRGTFTLQLETCLKLGLVMDEPNYPSFVRGVVKGSSSHRSGQLLPGDEILSFSTVKDETLNLQTWTMRKTKTHHLTVLREPSNVLRRKEASKRCLDLPFDPTTFAQSGSHFNIKRTSIRTVQNLRGQDKMVLEQEFTLFRDPLTWEFGFLFGVNPQTGNAYITDIRPGGPADNCKIIKKYDRIVEVNGVLVDRTAENSIMSLFTKTSDQVHLVTRRILHYR